MSHVKLVTIEKTFHSVAITINNRFLFILSANCPKINPENPCASVYAVLHIIPI